MLTVIYFLWTTVNICSFDFTFPHITWICYYNQKLARYWIVDQASKHFRTYILSIADSEKILSRLWTRIRLNIILLSLLVHKVRHWATSFSNHCHRWHCNTCSADKIHPCWISGLLILSWRGLDFWFSTLSSM